MLIAIAGGKNVTNASAVIARLDTAEAKYADIILVHGDGPGVERIAAPWAERNGVHPVVCKPDWNAHARAGLMPVRTAVAASTPGFLAYIVPTRTNSRIGFCLVTLCFVWRARRDSNPGPAD